MVSQLDSQRVGEPSSYKLPNTPFVVPVSGTVVQSVPLTPHARAVVVSVSVPGNVGSMSITGGGSGATLYTTATPPSGAYIIVPVMPAIDTNLSISVTANGNGAVLVQAAELDEAWSAVQVIGGAGIGQPVSLAGVTAPAALTDGAATPTSYLFGAPALLWNGSAWVFERTPNVFKTGTATAAGNTTIWTPAAGKRFRLISFSIEVTENAIQAVAGVNTLSFNDSGAAVGLAYSPWIPAAALTGNQGGYTTGAVWLGNGYLSAAANNLLQINLATALTGGAVRVNAWGTEE